jgi:hypothetical protein
MFVERQCIGLCNDVEKVRRVKLVASYSINLELIS